MYVYNIVIFKHSANEDFMSSETNLLIRLFSAFLWFIPFITTNEQYPGIDIDA